MTISINLRTCRHYDGDKSLPLVKAATTQLTFKIFSKKKIL